MYSMLQRHPFGRTCMPRNFGVIILPGVKNLHARFILDNFESKYIIFILIEKTEQKR